MLKFVILILLYVSSISCISNTTFDSLKKGIMPFNSAGNTFMNFIRGDVNPGFIDKDKITNMTLSVESALQIAKSYIGHTVFLAVGITFAVLIPIIGLFFCFCRCCGRCGGKVKPMDPKNVKCKKVVYGIILAALSIGMIFAVIITLFNNQIVHETVINHDSSINMFLNTRTILEKIKPNLETMKSEIEKSESSLVENQHLQQLYQEMEEAIRMFFNNFMTVPVVLDLIEKSQSVKQDVTLLEKSNYKDYLQNANQLLRTFNAELIQIKDAISLNLSSCSEPACEKAKDKTQSLLISQIDENQIKNFTDLLDSLNSTDFKERFDKMANMNTNDVLDVKLILQREINYIKEKINKKEFSGYVKTILNNTINKMIEIRRKISQHIPLPMKNESDRYDNYLSAKSIEFYRYYIYIGLSCCVVLITSFYLLGLLYGNCGVRPEEDAGCFNRGVGANFLMISVVLTFTFSSLVMITVLANILTTSMVQTDVCRYAPPTSGIMKNTIVYDRYIQVVAGILTDVHNSSDGVSDALFNKCQEQNFYLSFSKVLHPLITKSLQGQFEEIDNKVVSSIANQLNMDKYLSSDPFVNISSIDVDKFEAPIVITVKNDNIKMFITELRGLGIDTSSIQSLNTKVTRVKAYIRVILQHIINIENQYIKWKSSATIFNDNKINLIKSKSSIITENIRKNLLSVLNLLFGTMFANVPCDQLRKNIVDLLTFTCENVVDPLNGCWYGLGFFLLLVIPALIFACLLVSLYRRIQKYYPDKDEPDYENYIGFYARSDNEAAKSSSINSKPPHRGYRPIPLQ